MDSQLIAALQERIEAGHTKDQIREEMLALGYTLAAFEVAYASAQGETVLAPLPAPVSVATPLLGYMTLAKSGFTLARTQVLLLIKTVVAFLLICLSTAFFIQITATSLTAKLESGDGYTPAVALLAAAIVVTLFAAILGSISIFAAILRVLLKRHEVVRYRDSIWWVLKNIDRKSVV